MSFSVASGAGVDDVAALKEQVRQLHAVLCEGFVPPAGWGLSQSHAVIVGVLLARDLATHEALMTALYAGRADDPPCPKVLHVFMHDVRARLRAQDISVSTERGRGWFLTADMKAKLREAVA